MQYEVYPENTEQASRQIFIVNEVEVRDRLSLSKINKFLYQYTSESLPRQTHANMVCNCNCIKWAMLLSVDFVRNHM